MVGLGGGHRGLTQQVHRAGHAGLPEAPELAQRLLRRLPGDEPVRHVADSGRGRASQRPCPAGGVRGAQRGVQRRRALGHLLQVRRQVPGQVGESSGTRASRRPAGRAPSAAPRRARPVSIARASTTLTGLRDGRGSASWISVPIVLIAARAPRPHRTPALARCSPGLTPGASGSGTTSAMPALVLGPLLRYVGRDQRRVWVETDEPCEVEVLGSTAPTFHVAGHHYGAGADRRTSSPAPRYEYEVELDGEKVWPPKDSELPAQQHPHLPEGRARCEIAFGSCRVAAPHEPPYTLTKDEDDRGPRGRRAARDWRCGCATQPRTTGRTCC